MLWPWAAGPAVVQFPSCLVVLNIGSGPLGTAGTTNA